MGPGLIGEAVITENSSIATEFEDPFLSTLVIAAGDELRRHRIRVVLPQLADAGITSWREATVVLLVGEGADSFSDVVNISRIPKSSLSAVVQRLVEKNILERWDDPNNRSRSLLKVVDPKLPQRIRTLIEDTERDILTRTLHPDQVCHLRGMLRLIRDAARAEQTVSSRAS